MPEDKPGQDQGEKVDRYARKQEKYDAYISRWHYFLKELSRIVREDTEGILSRNLSMYVLKEFYLTPYDRNGDFYAQIEKRIGKAEAVFGISHS